MPNISQYRGDTWNFTIVVTDSASVAVDISAYTFYFTMKTGDITDGAALIGPISVTTGSHSDPVNGTTIITASAAVTDVIVPGRYFYDIQMKDGSGEITTIISGLVTVKIDYTRATT